MLLELNIRDFAIIDNLSISFGNGLNVLTGETGAGKSIIIDAVKLILGDRAGNDIIRTSSDEARIEALFDISGNKYLKELLDSSGFDTSDCTLAIKRIVSKKEKGRVFINSSNSTISFLSETSKNLIDIYGQHDHQSLLNPDSHIEIFDSFLDLISLRERVSGLFEELSCKETELNRLKEIVRTGKDKQDFLAFQIQEIESAVLKPDEDIELKKERERLANAERLFETSSNGYEILYSQEGSVLEKIGQVLNRLKDAEKHDESLKKTVSELESCLYQIEEVSNSLRDYSQDITFDPRHIEEIDFRLDLINRLKRKYGGTINEIIDKKEKMCIELKSIQSSDERIKELEDEAIKIKEDALNIAMELSKKRNASKKRFKDAIESELNLLNMKKAVFLPKIFTTELTANGIDSIEFFMSPNIGEEPKPLAKIASGGELSRIMLALKRVSAKAKSVPVLIFDEIDAGIGGGTAEVVGKKLKEVSKYHQVLCITHLPQIASYADRHFHVSKSVKAGRTVTEVKELKGDERIMEISRMLGGVKITEKTMAHAKEMLENACIR